MTERTPGTGEEQFNVTVVRRLWSGDGKTCTVTYREVGGDRTFTQILDRYPLGGGSAPMPASGSSVILHVNQDGEVTYAGHPSATS